MSSPCLISHGLVLQVGKPRLREVRDLPGGGAENVQTWSVSSQPPDAGAHTQSAKGGRNNVSWVTPPGQGAVPSCLSGPLTPPGGPTAHLLVPLSYRRGS